MFRFFIFKTNFENWIALRLKTHSQCFIGKPCHKSAKIAQTQFPGQPPRFHPSNTSILQQYCGTFCANLDSLINDKNLGFHAWLWCATTHFLKGCFGEHLLRTAIKYRGEPLKGKNIHFKANMILYDLIWYDMICLYIIISAKYESNWEWI